MRFTLSITALVVALASFTVALPAIHNTTTTSALSTPRHHSRSTSTGSEAHHNSAKTTSDRLPFFTGRPTDHNSSSTQRTSNLLPFFTGRPTHHNGSSTEITNSRRHTRTHSPTHLTHSASTPSAHPRTFTGTGTNCNNSSPRTTGPHESLTTFTANSPPSGHKRNTIVRRDTASGTLPWTSSQTLLVVEVILLVAAAIIVLLGLFVFPGCFGLRGLIRSRRHARKDQGDQHGEWIEMQGVGRERHPASTSTPAPAPIKPAVLKKTNVNDLAPGWDDVEFGEVEVLRNR